ncbi:hypothetical protein [Polaribacter sp.]|uniref:hypothetical protein n=1 Tax=Polaribacter sp. TaxID=1920175 RepID=UPI003F6A43ED
MKNKTDEDQLEQSVPKIDTRIAAVRDLIFGENIQQYNTEFEDVYERITSLETTTKQNLAKAVDALETKFSDLESLMDHKFQDLNSDLDKKLTELDDEKTDRRKLGKALEKIALMLQE